MNRKPIIINNSTIACIFIYNRDFDSWLDWVGIEADCTDNEKQTREAAKLFIDHLDEHWTPRLLQCLRDECEKRLKDR
uniref:Uncharacterized protein n=1 Tax=viral metagenome TaxID=1070528 RepID=A0A6M3LD13_9ZZZZ